MEDTARNARWHLDRKVPLALIATIIGQTLVAAWGASNLWARVDELERQVRSAAPQAERIIRLEEKIGAVQEGVVEIKSMIRRTLSESRH